MPDFMAATGSILSMLAVFIAACIAFAIAFALLLRLLEYVEDKGRLKARKELIQRFLADAHWFSEHPPTYQILHDFGVNIFGSDYGVSTLRDAWREELRKFDERRAREAAQKEQERLDFISKSKRAFGAQVVVPDKQERYGVDVCQEHLDNSARYVHATKHFRLALKDGTLAANSRAEWDAVIDHARGATAAKDPSQ